MIGLSSFTFSAWIKWQNDFLSNKIKNSALVSFEEISDFPPFVT